ncbi:MAG: HAD family phosphatase [Clostridia bacterium]|nr:HAD family phosphatase [Clostridia bacterium]
MKQTYLFDFDGTLVDSMSAFAALMLRILDEHGISYGEDIVKIITPLGYRGTAAYFQTLGIKKSVEEMMEIMHRYAKEEYELRIPAKKTVAETLHTMKARGDSLNVLTASPHAVLDPCLKRLELWELFDHVWSCDDFGTTKADPDIYVRAAERLGCAPRDVIFVDDNVGAVKTAKRAGMKAVGIYDDSSADYVEEMKAVSHRYIYTLSALLQDG